MSTCHHQRFISTKSKKKNSLKWRTAPRPLHGQTTFLSNTQGFCRYDGVNATESCVSVLKKQIKVFVYHGHMMTMTLSKLT